jgi:hypothetical protein
MDTARLACQTQRIDRHSLKCVDRCQCRGSACLGCLSDVGDRGHVRRQLRDHGHGRAIHDAADDTLHRFRDRADFKSTSFQVGARYVDLECGDAFDSGQSIDSVEIFLDRQTPDTDDRRRRPGQVLRQELFGECNGSVARDPDGVEHSSHGLIETMGGISRARFGKDSLGNEGPEAIKVHDRPEFGAETSRCWHDGVPKS